LHAETFLREAARVAVEVDKAQVERLASELLGLRERRGHLYLIGLGGSAANASHAAADFRRLCDIKAHAPTDSMAEFSARVNDEGFDSAFTGWLQTSHAWRGDAIFVLSVGGGTETVSRPITLALRYAIEHELRILGIVGPDGGETDRLGHCVVKVPAPQPRITPHTEAFQAVLWHALVSHPVLQRNLTKW
jgi:D-sedoheptulose 7-phosphate isomerase